MSTSGGGTLNALLYVAMLTLSLQVGLGLLGARPAPRLTPTAVGLWLLVAVPSLLQLPFPALLRALRRDPHLIRAHGQVWRLATSLLVQDGGIAGTAFNLVILALVVTVAVDVWGPVRATVALLAAQLIFTTLAAFLSNDLGAGNSGATFGLASSMVGLAVTRRPVGRATAARSLGVVGVGAALLAIGDAHGIPVLGGLLIGVLLARTWPSGPDPASTGATGGDPARRQPAESPSER